jgi:hypothetical protein
MNTETKLKGNMGGDDSLATSPDPLSPSRTDLDSSDRPGVDELPDNEGAIPLDIDDDAPIEGEMADIDVDNAEFDEQPTPR